jgi:SynChlorMet cassette radical SAM/SPASM protein ScmF
LWAASVPDVPASVPDVPASVPGPPPLAQIYFYLTAGCNLACRHCWLAPPFDPRAEMATLPVELFERAVAEAKPLGLGGVKLTGGEPLLHPQFMTLVDLTAAEGLGLTVETNGTLLTEEHCARFAEIPATFVSVSIDGSDAATHDAVRGVRGSFDKALAAVALLAAAGVRTQIIFSVMRENADQLEAVIRLAEESGAGSLKFNVVQPTARGERIHDAEAALGVGDYVRLGRLVDRELAPAAGIGVTFDCPPAFRPLRRVAAARGRGQCGIFGIIGVIADGRYALCGIGEQVPELVFGVVGEDALAEIWRSHPTLVELREGLPSRLGGVCAGCLMSRGCLGSCIAQNYYRTRDLFAPYWFCEEAEREGVFPDSRRR